MTKSLQANPVPRLFLHAETAADLMMPNPVSIRADASVQDAIAMLTAKGFSAAPVIDATGRPVGVLSHTDILVHDHEKLAAVRSTPGYYDPADSGTPDEEPRAIGFPIEQVQVRDLMTPVVFSVRPQTPTQ